MKITLKELNDSYQSLLTVGESVTGGKMKYRLSRLIKSAKEAVEAMGEALAGIAEKHGAEMLGGNRFQFDQVKQKDAVKAFNKEADEFLKTEIVELWGDTQYFPFSELEKAEDEEKKVSAAVLADLLWLFSDDTDQKEEKAAAANA